MLHSVIFAIFLKRVVQNSPKLCSFFADIARREKVALIQKARQVRSFEDTQHFSARLHVNSIFPELKKLNESSISEMLDSS